MSTRKIRVDLTDIMLEEAVDFILENYYGLDPSEQSWEVEKVDQDLTKVKLLVDVYDEDWDETEVYVDFVEVIDD